MDANSPLKSAQESDPRVPLAEKRTNLATFRTAQSLDRTTLAWIRTTLTMNSFGFGLIAFFRTVREQKETPETIRMHQTAIHFGEGLVVIGTLATIAVALSHARSLYRLRRGELPEASRLPLSIAVALLLALLTMIGLWSFHSN